MCAVELVCDICAWNWNYVILLQRFLYRLWVLRPDLKMILFSAIVERASESDLLRQLLEAYNKDLSALHFKRHLLKSTTNFIDASKMPSFLIALIRCGKEIYQLWLAAHKIPDS
jgi:hypothetical protein